MSTLAWILVAGLATFAVIAALERLPKALTLAFFLAAIPLAVALRSSGKDEASFFSLAKMAAVGLGAAYVQAARITRWTDRPLGRVVGFAILAANIIEAVIAEAAQGGYLNASAGLLLLLTQASPRHVGVAERGGRTELRYALGDLWLAAYVVWNFAFVYGRESHGAHAGYAAMAVVHLGVPLLAMRGQSEMFIQHRAFALTAMMILRLTAPRPPFLALSTHWYHPLVATALGAVSFALAALVAGRSLSCRSLAAPPPRAA